jgi:DNA-binding transcriptional MerR regulator
LRHYEKMGLLLREPERSESGYRLYSAEDLMRLHRIKKLRSLGLSLGQIRSVLGGDDEEASLRSILGRLKAEVDDQMARLEARRTRIGEMLARQDLETVEPSPTFEKAVALLGDRFSDVSARTLEQEKKLWATLDAFDWPDGYERENEAFFRHYAERPDEHRALVLIGERLSELAEAPDNDPRIEAVARDLLRHFEEFPPPEEYRESSMWSSEGPLGEAMFSILMSGLSPAQRRCVHLVAEYAEQRGREARED